MAEWPNVTDSKSVVPERVPGVRIPPSPPFRGYMHVLSLCQLVRDGDTNCDILAQKCNFKWASYFMDNLIYNSIRTTYDFNNATGIGSAYCLAWVT